MQLWAQLLVNGLSIGFVYTLIASGFSLIFGVSRVLNMAHGQMYMLGAVAAVVFMGTLHINFFLALAMSMIGVAILGALMERGLLRPRRGQEFTIVIITMAIAIIIPPATGALFGFQQRSVPHVVSGRFEAFGIFISKERLMILAARAIMFALLYFFIQRTKIGSALRAISQDDTAAALQGIDINRHSLFSMGIAAAMAAAAGVLVAPLYFVDTSIGHLALVKAIVVVVLGGMGSITGAAVAGVTLGVAESLGSGFLGEASDLVGLGFVLLVLMWKPLGLFGRE